MALKWLLNLAHAILLEHPSSDGGAPCAERTTADQSRQNVGDQVKMERGVDEGFRMPLHYPRYVRSEYEKMEEWRVDLLLREYGLSCDGSLDDKRRFAMGTFLWPDQL